MKHIVLFGDSIFDNAPYVQAGHAVIDHLHSVGNGAKATLLARDGAVVSSVFDQLARCPSDATDLFLSVGGNDALELSSSLFAKPSSNVGKALGLAHQQLQVFAEQYRRVIAKLVQLGKPLTVCTIYDHVPDLEPLELGGLMMFNDIITRAAWEASANLIDLRLLCRDPLDYSEVSPIEPSDLGGRKIAAAIAEMACAPECRVNRPCVIA
jgi:hypothetical protein